MGDSEFEIRIDVFECLNMKISWSDFGYVKISKSIAICTTVL